MTEIYTIILFITSTILFFGAIFVLKHLNRYVRGFLILAFGFGVVTYGAKVGEMLFR